MHHFKRFYLILSILASLGIPLLEFNQEASHILSNQATLIISSKAYLDQTIRFTTPAASETAYAWESLCLIGYSFIAMLLLTRFIYLNWFLWHQIKTNVTESYHTATLVLLNKPCHPHSFLNFIFLEKKRFQQGLVYQQILDHELAHVRQKHSFDVLFVELVLIFCWFNPFFYWMRSAIQLNHEFLADEVVLHKHQNLTHYQHLILHQIAMVHDLKPEPAISSPFNYSQTKTRLTMMTRTQSIYSVRTKQFGIAPIFLLAILLFSSHSFAQQVNKALEKQKVVVPKTTSEQELQHAFDAIMSKYKKENQDGGWLLSMKFSDLDREQLTTLYFQMSDHQKSKQLIRISKASPLKKVTPTQQLFEQWKDPKQFGVWIDHKRVPNSVLNHYAHTDFSRYSISKLAKNTVNYGKHVYQLDLTTNTQFELHNQHIEEANTFHIFPNVLPKTAVR